MCIVREGADWAESEIWEKRKYSKVENWKIEVHQDLDMFLVTAV